MSPQQSGPTIRTADQGPVHINDISIQVDYSCDDNNDFVTELRGVPYINLHVNNNNNNNNFNNNLHTQRRRRHPHQTTLFQYLPPSFHARYGDDNDESTNDLWGQSFTTKMQNII